MAAVIKRVERTAFRASRALDYATVEELTRETGHPPARWPLVVMKELVDNALDACEETGVAPAITVRVDDGGIEVADNGPGLPPTTVEGVVDLDRRVSSRSAYVAPDRGAQGNALKTLIAMPFVLGDGAPGKVTITARGLRHRITFGLDALRQRPEVVLTSEAVSVRAGTSVRVHWPRSACSTLGSAEAGFYRFARSYAALNPHLTLLFDFFGTRTTFEAFDPEWVKWKPSRPTSAHWYTPERLARLIAAYLGHDEDAGRATARTVRDFVALFDGLTGTAKRKQVLDATGLHRTPLRSLVREDGFDTRKVGRLLTAMQEASKPVSPKALGPVGREALSWHLECEGIDPETFKYRCFTGTAADGQPWIVEAAFGAYQDPDEGRLLLTGVNWSPGVLNPFRSLMDHYGGLDSLLAEKWIEGDSPVVVAAHAIVPGAAYTDRGKTALSLPWPAGQALTEVVTAVTKAWAAQQAREHRDAQARLRRREALTERKPERVTKKDAAYRVMRQAYLKASANNTLPANARQIYYAARPLILALIADGEQIDDHYFTQTLLPDYEREHPEETADWDVVYDARGHLVEPHTGREVALGTLAVRQYVGERPMVAGAVVAGGGTFAWPTSGPHHRFRAALFIEKEGFDPLFRATRFAERHDIAIMSTKGMSVVALRLLVDRWAELGVKILVAHDLDVSGFSIFGTLARSGRRYTYKNKVEVIDIGLRLADVEEWGLESEPVVHKGRWEKKAETLRRHGATEEEIALLRKERVELNAFASDQLIAWLESKLVEHGVTKVVPDAATLAAAYRAAAEHEHVASRMSELRAAAQRAAAELAPPDDLAERVRRLLERDPHLSWDEAVDSIARDAL